MVIKLDNIVRGEEPYLHTRGMIASRGVNMVRHPRGSCTVLPIAVTGVAIPEHKVYIIRAVIHTQESRHKVPKSVVRAVLGRMQFTLHATRRTPQGASRMVQAMSAWLVKTRRAPSRHSRDARIYGHTTMAMHKLSTRPLSPNLPYPQPLPHPPSPRPTRTPPPSPSVKTMAMHGIEYPSSPSLLLRRTSWSPRTERTRRRH